MNKLLFVIALVSVIIILPINLTGENVSETSGIDKVLEIVRQSKTDLLKRMEEGKRRRRLIVSY